MSCRNSTTRTDLLQDRAKEHEGMEKEENIQIILHDYSAYQEELCREWTQNVQRRVQRTLYHQACQGTHVWSKLQM